MGDRIVDDIASAVDHVEDDVLRLMFVCCHPTLGPDAQVTLTLRLMAGLTTAEIARSFLTSESTIAARITRAKKNLARVADPTEEPVGDERVARLSGVLRVVYLLFNEGYSATAGDDWLRADLCAEAVRLGRVLAELVPSDPEVHGLVALMELQHSRSAARIAVDGTPVLLLEQDRSRWDGLLVRRGLAALDRATSLGAPVGPYVLQAEIAACHARARVATDTDWSRIASVYAVLAGVTGSAVVELNRVVAVSFADGPEAALSLLDAADLAELTDYHLLPSVRADLLAKIGRTSEAVDELERAASLTTNQQERSMLLERATSLASGHPDL